MKKLLLYCVLLFFSASQTAAQNTINQYEYWFDGNFSNKVIVNTTPESNPNIIQNVPTASLIPGLHVFNIRFRDAASYFSSVISQHFYKPAASGNNNLTGYEYWFDNNYAGKVSQTVSPQNTLDLITGINANAMS